MSANTPVCCTPLPIAELSLGVHSADWTIQYTFIHRVLLSLDQPASSSHVASINSYNYRCMLPDDTILSRRGPWPVEVSNHNPFDKHNARYAHSSHSSTHSPMRYESLTPPSVSPFERSHPPLFFVPPPSFFTQIVLVHLVSPDLPGNASLPTRRLLFPLQFTRIYSRHRDEVFRRFPGIHTMRACGYHALFGLYSISYSKTPTPFPRCSPENADSRSSIDFAAFFYTVGAPKRPPQSLLFSNEHPCRRLPVQYTVCHPWIFLSE